MTKKLKKKKPKKRVKLITIPKLKKKCYALWSEIVRLRDGCCILSGTTELLQAHHWIISSARSLKYRYDIRNGVTLTFATHLRGVHTEASYAYIQAIAEAAIARGILTSDELNEIAHAKPDNHDLKRDDLNAILAGLLLKKQELEALQHDRPQSPGGL